MTNQTPQDVEKELNGDTLHLMIFKHLETMLDRPDEFGLYQTTDFMVSLKKDLEAYIAQSNKAYLLSVLPDVWATPPRRDYETDRQMGYNDCLADIKKNAGLL